MSGGRVLIVLHELTLGGATRQMLRPAEVLRERGWEVSFWCGRPSELHDDLVRLGYDVDGAPRLMRYRWRTLRHPPGVRARLRSLPASQRSLRRRLRERPPDLVHVNGRLALPEAFTARLAGFPVAIYIHDDALPGLRGLVGRVAPWMVGVEVMATSRAHARGFTLGKRVPRLINACAPVPELIARAVKPPAARVVVGTLGVVSARKGSDLFVDAAELLQREGQPVDMRIAGPIEDGPVEAWARAQVARGAAAGVRYLGRVDVAAVLPEWDVMVLPSRADPSPLVVVEAMAAGVAVVGAAVDGIPEQIGDGAGVLVPPEDPHALAQAIAALAADPERRADLGARGHRRMLERYTPERTADQIEAVWNAALTGRGGE